jgi:SPP1 gp7 family putative phage head morphogenesis protein
MVGKKWVNGALVDNPDAEWVITDSTRDEIQGVIADYLSNQIELKNLTGAIQDAGAFSKARAELIARTEVSLANNQGKLTSYKAARDSGISLKKEWSPDADPCPICQDNADQGAIDVDDDFDSGDDSPPAHPSCECTIVGVVEHEDDDDES